MELSKQDKTLIKELGRAAKIVHEHTLELKVKLIEAGFDKDFVVENLESIAVGEMSASDFIEALEEEIDYKKR